VELEGVPFPLGRAPEHRFGAFDAANPADMQGSLVTV
jgi:hypothetical protein